MRMNSDIDSTLPTDSYPEDIKADQDLKLLVQAMMEGDVTALARLHEKTVRQVFTVAYFKLRSKEDAEEIVADVYVHAWRAAASYDVNRGSVRAWLSMMTRNRAIDRRRRRRVLVSLSDQRQEALAMSLVGTAPGPEQTFAGVQSSAAVHRALQSLSEERRALVRLAFFEDRTHEEIAAVVGLPLGTVKSHVRRALAAMQRHMLTET